MATRYPLFFVSRLLVTKGVGENHSSSVAVTMIQGDSSRQVNFDQLPCQSCFFASNHDSVIIPSWFGQKLLILLNKVECWCHRLHPSLWLYALCWFGTASNRLHHVGDVRHGRWGWVFHFVVIGDFEVWCASFCDEGFQINQRPGSSARSGKAFQAAPRTLCLDRSQMVHSHLCPANHASSSPSPSSSSSSSSSRFLAFGRHYHQHNEHQHGI